MKTVILFISNSVYTSDLLRTRYIQYLSSKYKVVVLLLLSQQDINMLNYYQHPNIVYFSWPKEQKFWTKMKTVRLLAINEFDYLRNTTALVGRKKFAHQRNPKTKLIYYFFRALTKLGIKITADFCTKLEILFAPARSKLFNQIYSQYKPDLLITASPGFGKGEAELIILAKRKKIPTLAADFSWDNLSSKAQRMRKTDYLIVWNDLIKQEAVNIHKYPPERVFVSGIMRFDYYFREEEGELDRRRFLESKGLNPNYKTILLSTCSPGVYNRHREVIKRFLDWRQKGKIENANLYARLHPKDTENYQDFINIENVYIDKGVSSYKLTGGRNFLEMSYNDLLNLKYTLKYSDININAASTISLEACAFDVPVINLYVEHYYNRYHYKPIVEGGAVKLVYNDQDLLNAINNYLKNPQEQQLNRKELVRRYIQFTDGLSYKRSVDFLDKIIS